MKRCKQCGVEKKETSEFFYFRKDTQKFKNICRECHNRYNRSKYYEYNNETVSYKNERQKLYDSGFLRCSDCGGIMTLDKFNSQPSGFANKKPYCKNCQKIRRKKVVESESQKERWNRSRRLKKYGLTFEQYEAVMLKQNNKCKICGTEVDMTTVAIDHCHSNGHIRGFLCGTCNSGLGFFKDNTDYLRTAIEYLNNNGKELKLVAITTGVQNP